VICPPHPPGLHQTYMALAEAGELLDRSRRRCGVLRRAIKTSGDDHSGGVKSARLYRRHERGCLPRRIPSTSTAATTVRT
jgi:hypothetical protein